MYEILGDNLTETVFRISDNDHSSISSAVSNEKADSFSKSAFRTMELDTNDTSGSTWTTARGTGLLFLVGVSVAMGIALCGVFLM